ncbi:hypothetical protein KGA66_24525 [Actinocrinis puniceicyclus]|uniref:Secreted protein n=1 Tax=Actinocrinis puniceicyclus TaxID=977794 RepID=A0A8J8BEC4_9ACTN|nr:hypothetical protein [Actinocrinis puniceicyclus]MBS2966233.1 hypothetical protein [Actinocrinis puniceicyclus]
MLAFKHLRSFSLVAAGTLVTLPVLVGQAASAATASTTTGGSATYIPATSPDLPRGSATYTAANAAGPAASVTGVPQLGSSLRAGSIGAPAAITPNASWICSVYTSDPSKTIEEGQQVIFGESDQLCSGVGYAPVRTVTVIQQYRGLGFWANKDSFDTGLIDDDYSGADAWWICASGTGNQLYRVIGDNYAEANAYEQSVQSLNYLRVTCPS